MGMFLRCNADSVSSSKWACCAEACLEFISQNGRAKNRKLSIRHTFNHTSQDWGSPAFTAYNDLFNPANDYVVDNSIQARITVEIVDPFNQATLETTNGYEDGRTSGSTNNLGLVS
ncbi:unnamed protein product [Dibothriocephalus latus]|uniref:MATH domain-containing protein n=1 Tax=Dibothriocephalus latus TaxID=60516 RepID=A0A3P7RHI5_DIBLA|nr:unnamed protein product [Dibothriocephalus latus]